MNLRQLRQADADNTAAMATLRAEGRKLLAVAERTPEQTARLDAIDAELDTRTAEAARLSGEIARMERYHEQDRADGAGQAAIQVGVDHATERPWGPAADSTAPAYRQREARHTALGNFARAVRAAYSGEGTDPRLMAVATGGGTQTDSNLGFAVPQEIAPGIEREMFEVGQLLGRVDARSVTGNTMTYNVFDETNRADGSRGGGVLGYWVDEGTAPTLSNMKLARIEMKLRKVGALGAMTDELLADATALGGELEQSFRDELVWQVENKIYRGSGANAPLGFLNAPCLVTVNKESNQASATIVGANITKMVSRIPPRSLGSFVWLANAEIRPALAELVLPIGTGGVRYPYASVDNAGTMSLWGRPVVFCEYAEALGTVGDIAAVDLSRYRLIRKGGVEQASSMHVYFSTGEQAFRAFYRVDGQPVPRAPLTPFKGSATLSPFVVLQSR